MHHAYCIYVKSYSYYHGLDSTIENYIFVRMPLPPKGNATRSWPDSDIGSKKWETVPVKLMLLPVTQ